MVFTHAIFGKKRGNGSWLRATDSHFLFMQNNKTQFEISGKKNNKKEKTT